MANYDINYNDQRFVQVESQKNTALSDLENTYAGMINNSDKYYQAQIDASKEWADKQTQLQQEKTDFAIEKIEQQKEQAKKDYTKEQSGAYVDWQKQSNQYGANAEQMAAQGMAGSGYSESSKVSMYNTYQNRITTAREVYNQAVLSYNNSITEARLQNNSLLAEIAYNALQQQLELALQGFQYKNTLILDKTEKKLQVEEMYYGRYQDVLAQINHENALAEQIRQYNESKALEEAKLAEEKRQFDETMAWTKSQAAAKSYGGGDSDYVVNDTGNDKVVAERVWNTASGNKPEKTEKIEITNRHVEGSWIEIPGHGRFSMSEIESYLEDGTVKIVASGNNSVTYKWVGKSKNVTPDDKGYAAKQKQLLGNGTAKAGRML